MPTISKIRFTNVIYEDGMKRYNDETFKFDGYNGAILLENGGGKTVFIQTALQAVIPHTSLADRKIKQTLQLDNYPAHIAIEWILSESPRQYLVTCVSLYLTKDGLDSYRYVYEYMAGDKHGIDNIPFVRKESNRPSDRGEISDYYFSMAQQYMNAHTFPTIKGFQQHIEKQYHIIPVEWESIVKINSTEGGVEAFFDECKQTNQLFDRLLIPTVEEAIAGHNSTTFADTFEKHRASFKLYKELKEQIEENKAIGEQLNRYASTYEGLFSRQQEYEQVKGRAKAILEKIKLQDENSKQELQNLIHKMKIWEEEETESKKKHLSLELYKDRLFLKEIEAEWKEAKYRLSLGEGSLDAAKKQFHSLKLAQLKKEWKEAGEALDFHKGKLTLLDQNEDIQDINDRLDENSRELKGYFEQEVEEVLKQIRDLKLEMKPIEDAIGQIDKDMLVQQEMLGRTNTTLDKNAGAMEIMESQMNKIKQQILSKPNEESVRENLPKWEQRLVYLDKEIVQLKNENKRIAGLLIEQRNKQERLESEKNNLGETHNLLKQEVERADLAQEKMKGVLAGLYPQWTLMDSLYLKQESILRQVEDELVRLERERETSLFRERIAFRRIDDYGEQNVFFADPFLEKQLRKWTGQFGFLMTGVQFIQSLEQPDREVAGRYPFWPAALVTRAADLDKVVSKIQSIEQQLQVPIHVLSIEQAGGFIRGEIPDMNVVEPDHWRHNGQIDVFQEWKRAIRSHAENARQARLEIERHIQKWKNAEDKLLAFLHEYSYEHLQGQKNQLNELSQMIQHLEVQLRETRAFISENENRLKTQEEKIKVYTDELNGLEGKLSQARDYLHTEQERDKLASQQERLSEEKIGYERLLNRYKEQREGLIEELEIKRDEAKEAAGYHTRLIDDLIFQEVKTAQALYTGKSKRILQEERDELKLQLRQISSSRNEIELKVIQVEKDITRCLKGMDDIRLENGSLDEELVFPPNGNERIVALRNRIKELELSVKQEKENYDAQNTRKIKQETAVESALNKFEQAFPLGVPLSFEGNVKETESKLKEENRQLKERRAFLKQEEVRVQGELTSLENAFHQLDRFEEAHHFKGPSVQAAVLSENELQAFAYERPAFIKEATDQLVKVKNLVGIEWERVGKAKDAFMTFCKNKISNVKLREMARQGIDSKKTYQEVLEFQGHMQKRIQTAIKYNEATIIDHDRQLEQFVTHINSHLLTIAEELSIIPKKTKVKVDDKWKEVFHFSIPEWTREEGKSRIRKHVEWILEQLDSDRYLNTDGAEDYGKVRKEIETWTHSKQLLRIVMNNESMKVTCRKVTNDNQVTTRSYSWEQTNAWSGGEKWSKNMTLFLGILNYVSEKRQHSVTKAKRHRVVIMDNPFGKASSDHVLNPVFFIAEQLGFQIIALTAHAEGKFLRDYFPVIYSCRLRKAADSNKQIMTKVKQLHQAYFQDHEPQALERLGEMEQMELFS
ncbi:hypothetical protein AM500_18345 [Bacillus sp. FJAT-18017]|uniref:hypothetical protein n=1 Tax=Bacillus sp. FJAT-18017 TaxID=1705566 RepID=UPI0006AF15AF|nr:hypothetical protein [Bacillus sp. FJAT-18017]ALC91525.1 hypothetical protein AM500_18345 [Bacillus sp. FJAT-18017]